MLKLNKIYQKIVKEITTSMGNNSKYENELDDAGKALFGKKKWLGVFPMDKFVNRKKIDGYAIVNLDNSWQLGSHWIAVVVKNGEYLVHDSFGRKTKKIAPDLFGKGDKVRDTEHDAEQKKKEENCGQRSLAAIVVFDQLGKKAYMDL